MRITLLTFIISIFSTTVAFAYSDEPIVMENYLGANVSLSTEDIALAISTLGERIYSEESIVINNYLGASVSLSTKDLAFAISALSEGKYSIDDIGGGNVDGSINIKNPKISYEGNLYNVAGSISSAKGVCSVFRFKKYHAFEGKNSLGCEGVVRLNKNGEFNGKDGHNCGRKITVTTCSEYE